MTNDITNNLWSKSCVINGLELPRNYPSTWKPQQNKTGWFDLLVSWMIHHDPKNPHHRRHWSREIEIKKRKKKKLRRHVLDFFLCKSRNKKACNFGDSYQKPVYIEWKQRKINQLFPNEIASSVILNFVNDTRRLHSWKGVETCDPQGQSLSNGSLVQQRNLWLLLESLSSYFEKEAPERRGSLRPIYFTSI